MTVDLRGSATGSQFDNHDAIYAWAEGGLSGGTLAGNDGDPASFPRRTLAKASGTTGVEGSFAIGQAWRAVALRWAWCKEASGTGNVVWRVRYALSYPLVGGSATAMSLTTIAVGAIAAPAGASGTQAYALPSSTAAIATPEFFGAPLLHFAIEILGGDGGYTFAGDVSVIVGTVTRVD